MYPHQIYWEAESHGLVRRVLISMLQRTVIICNGWRKLMDATTSILRTSHHSPNMFSIGLESNPHYQSHVTDGDGHTLNYWRGRTLRYEMSGNSDWNKNGQLRITSRLIDNIAASLQIFADLAILAFRVPGGRLNRDTILILDIQRITRITHPSQ